MGVTVTLPIVAPTGLSAELVAGGSLEANTTYYYVVVAYDQPRISAYSVINFPFHSPISVEGQFTTDSVNKSAKVTWTNVSGATRYQILLTKVSGDYTNSGGYTMTLNDETVGSITSGTAGYTITAISTSNSVFHSVQLRNSHIGDISRSLGILRVDLNGPGIESLDSIYNAIVAAGFSDYCFYDGFNFILKGWIVSSGTTSGALVVTKKRLVFIKGGISNDNPNYIMRFGEWGGDALGATYSLGCAIDFQNCRGALRSPYSNGLQIYGCMVTAGHSLKTTYNEYKNTYYYTGNGAYVYLSGAVDGVKDSIIGVTGRGQSTAVRDLKWGQENNFSNYPHIRLRITRNANLPYSQSGIFYACQFLGESKLNFYCGGSFANSGYYTNFYDCEFKAYANGMLDSDSFSYGSMEAGKTTSNQYAVVNYSVRIFVVDLNGNPVAGATVKGTDSFGAPIHWIEHDDTIDRLVTGNVYTLDRTTDAGGKLDYYTRSYRVELNPENTAYPLSSDVIKTNYYPVTIVVRKPGYQTYTFVLDEIKGQQDLVITLPAARIQIDQESAL